MTFSRISSVFSLIGAGIVLSLLLIISVRAAENYQYEKPDLIISNLSQERSSTNEYTDFNITVKNQGTNVSRSSWVGLYVNNQFRRACSVKALNIGATATTKCRFYSNSTNEFSSLGNIDFIVDDMEEIWELNENNNTAYFNLQSGRSSVSIPSNVSVVTTTPQPVYTPVTSSPVYIPNTGVYTPVYSPVYTPSAIPVEMQNFGETTGQYISCHFTNSGLGKKSCIGSGTNVQSQTLFCTESLCRLKISAPSGTSVSIQSTCGSAQGVKMDGLNKNLTFTCPITSQGFDTSYSNTTNTSFPLLPIQYHPELSLDKYGNSLNTNHVVFGDKYSVGFNGGVMSPDDIISISQGEIVDLNIAFEDIDSNQENYVYKRIPNNFQIVDVIFPESVECRTRNYSEFSTIFCRGQEPFSEIVYRLRAVKKGSSEIYAKIQYSDNSQKVLDDGYIPFIIR